MCVIFGSISKAKVDISNLKKLIKHSEQRGKDSSGLIYYNSNQYKIERADYEITKLIKEVEFNNSNVVFPNVFKHHIFIFLFFNFSVLLTKTKSKYIFRNSR